MLKIKRAYEPYKPSDGYRILVDRLWPRGIAKADAHIDLWSKEVAPSSGLRKWFDHDPEKWAAFSKAYMIELKHAEALDALIDTIKEKKKVTLVFGAKDVQHTHALILQQVISKAINK